MLAWLEIGDGASPPRISARSRIRARSLRGSPSVSDQQRSGARRRVPYRANVNVPAARDDERRSDGAGGTPVGELVYDLDTGALITNNTTICCNPTPSEGHLFISGSHNGLQAMVPTP
jgi:hypothetical protein